MSKIKVRIDLENGDSCEIIRKVGDFEQFSDHELGCICGIVIDCIVGLRFKPDHVFRVLGYEIDDKMGLNDE